MRLQEKDIFDKNEYIVGLRATKYFMPFVVIKRIKKYKAKSGIYVNNPNVKREVRSSAMLSKILFFRNIAIKEKKAKIK